MMIIWEKVIFHVYHLSGFRDGKHEFAVDQLDVFFYLQIPSRPYLSDQGFSALSYC